MLGLLRDGLVHLLELVRDHAGALRVAERHRGVGERALELFLRLRVFLLRRLNRLDVLLEFRSLQLGVRDLGHHLHDLAFVPHLADHLSGAKVHEDHRENDRSLGKASPAPGRESLGPVAGKDGFFARRHNARVTVLLLLIDEGGGGVVREVALALLQPLPTVAVGAAGPSRARLR